jgi:hypothetical protein
MPLPSKKGAPPQRLELRAGVVAVTVALDGETPSELLAAEK